MDGDESTNSYVAEGAFYNFTFSKVKIIKSVVLKPVPKFVPKRAVVYAALSKNNKQIQGTVNYSGSGDLVITFKKAVPLLFLSLGDFTDNSSDWVGFSEINFYEE